jgi:TolA-binding protein
VKHETVTTTPQSSTSTPAAATPPASGGNGHSDNDAGYARMQAGDYAGAVPYLRRAVQELSGAGPSDPYEAFANYNLGYSLLQLGRCADAVPYLQRADDLEGSTRHEPRRDLKKAQHCAGKKGEGD